MNTRLAQMRTMQAGLILVTALTLGGCPLSDALNAQANEPRDDSENDYYADCEVTGDEICDGEDNNCDGNIDEDLVIDEYGVCQLLVDTDGDGVADALIDLDEFNDDIYDENENEEEDEEDVADNDGEEDEEETALAGLGEACDGDDADFCGDGVGELDDNGDLVCSDDPHSNVDICDNLDNDCDASTEDGSGVAPSVTFNVTGQQAGPLSAHWMLDVDFTPFVNNSNADSRYAYSNITYNADGRGNGSCAGLNQGSGQQTSSVATAENLRVLGGINDVTVKIDSLGLASFEHINVHDGSDNWDSIGNAGDLRTYDNGVGEIRVDGDLKLRVINIQAHFITVYPVLVAGLATGFAVGDIDVDSSDPAWVAELDPNQSGQVEIEFGTVSSIIQSCYGTYDITGLTIRPKSTNNACDPASIDSDNDSLIDLFDQTP